MQAIPSRVAHCIHPAVEVREGRGVVEELVEDAIDGLRVGLRAHAAIVGTDGGEGHLVMGLVEDRRRRGSREDL
jgi:hypothetical protein